MRLPASWPIRWRLTLLNVGVLVVTLLALGGLFLTQVDNALVGITAEHVKGQIASATQPPPSRGAGGGLPPREPGGFPGAGLPPAPVARPEGGGLPRDGSPPGVGPRDRASGPPADGSGGLLPEPPPRVGVGAPPGGPPAQSEASPFNLTNSATYLVNVLRGPDTGIVVFDSAGALVAASEEYEGIEPWPRATPDQLTVALAGGELREVVGQETRRTLLLVLPWRGPGGVANGALQVTRSLELTDQLGVQLRVALALGVLLAAGLAGAISLRATRVALRPLDRVILAARRIGAGQMDERLRLTRRDEIGELAEAFDTMLDRLAAALAAQKRFVADAAHELRTPLTALGGVVEMLQMGADRGDPTTVRRLLDNMEREIARLTRLVLELLTLSRLDAEQPVSQAPVQLAALVADVADATGLLAQGQIVVCDVGATPTILGDGDRLKQALLNLGANALAYTPAGGIVAFRLTSAPGAAQIVVADTGCGIDPDLLPRVKDRFVRGDASRSRGTGGSGLGLAIAHGIVEAHGGHLDLDSHVGVGTNAIITLPVALTEP